MTTCKTALPKNNVMTLVDSKLTMSQKHSMMTKKTIASWSKKGKELLQGVRDGGCDLSPLISINKHIQFWALQRKTSSAGLKDTKELELLSYKDSFKDLGQFSLKKRGFKSKEKVQESGSRGAELRNLEIPDGRE